MKKKLKWIFVLAVVVFIGMQFANPSLKNPPVIPGHDLMTTNPPPPEVAALLHRACYDCHSNETVWPWYSNIAPISWLLVHDVDEGRGKMNFSTGSHLDARDMIRQIQNGSMPKSIYLPLHPDANLSDTEKADLIAGITATFRGG